MSPHETLFLESTVKTAQHEHSSVVSFKVFAALPQHSVDGCEGEHGTAQRSTAQHSTAQHSTAQHSATEHKSQHATLWSAETRCRGQVWDFAGSIGPDDFKNDAQATFAPASAVLFVIDAQACTPVLRWECALGARSKAASQRPCRAARSVRMCELCPPRLPGRLGPRSRAARRNDRVCLPGSRVPGLALALALRTCSRATGLRSASEQRTPCQVNRRIFFEVFIHKVPCRCALQAIDARAALPGPTGART